MTKKHVLFLISKNTGLKCLKSFVLKNNNRFDVSVMTLDDANDSRSCLNEITNYCEINTVKISIVKNNNDFLNLIKGCQANAVFVCGWYWIIPEPVLNYFNKQVFGIHHSLLPKYRGFSPLVWSMINGDDVVGSSLFKISDGMDVGDIYYQWRVARTNKNIGNVLAELDSLISSDFGDIFSDIILEKNLGKAQDHQLASYCGKRTQNSGLIDWTLSNEQVMLFINAQSSPYPGAFFEISSIRYFIDSAELFTSPVYALPGQVVMFTKEGVVIACGNSQGILVKKIRGYETLKTIFNSLELVLGHS